MREEPHSLECKERLLLLEREATLEPSRAVYQERCPALFMDAEFPEMNCELTQALYILPGSSPVSFLGVGQ